MRSIKLFSAALCVAGLVSSPTLASAQGKVIASNDEWFTQTLGSTGADDRQLLKNAIDLFGLFAGSSVLIYSDNGFLANAGFTSFLTSQGLNPVINSTESESNFSNYSAVFVSSNTNVNLLTGYVNGGGNVFDIAGTGTLGSAAAEAAANNVFLNAFGLGYAPFFQGIAGNVNTSAFAGQGVFGAALFHDVNSVFMNNGNDVVYSLPVAGVTSEVFSVGDHGLFGVAQVTATPEPASLALMATGLFGLVPLIRRRRRQG
jgi:hypothetical protein